MPDADVPAGRSTPMPAAELLGVRVVHDDPDRVVCRLTITEEHLNQGLIAHGGVLFVLADTALGLLANPPGTTTPWVGTSFAVQLVRGVAIGDVVLATAGREHRSRRLQALTARLTRQDGTLVGTVGAQLLAGSAAPVEPVDPGRVRRRPVDPSAPLARALRAAARREPDPDGPDPDGPDPDDEDPDDVEEVLYAGEQPVGWARGDRWWLHPRWRGRPDAGTPPVRR